MAKPQHLGRPTMSYACLYAREFPLQALLRLRAEYRQLACIVLEGEPPNQTVCALNDGARALGAEPGMTRVEVETIPPLRILQRSLKEESATKAALLQAAGAFTPRLENCSTDFTFACVLDITGTEKLFGPPETLARALLDRLHSLGISAVIAASINFHAAVCMARAMSLHAPICVLPAGDELSALAPLPVSVLDCRPEQMETFSLWGIRSLGMLTDLPETELIARLGQEGKRLRRMARGERPHLFQPLQPDLTLEERMELDHPVDSIDSLLFAIGVMLDQLILRASSLILTLATVTVTLALEGGGSHIRTVRPALPSSDRQLWIKLLHLDLETHPPSAAIMALTVWAEPGSTSKVQLGLFSPQLPEPDRLNVTLARIARIVGGENIGKITLTDTNAPESFRVEPFTLPRTAASSHPQRAPYAAMRQLRPPLEIPITLQDLKPHSFFLQEQQYKVAHAYGPWLTSGNWWSPHQWSCEQWDIVARGSTGEWLCGCIVRDLLRGSWLLAGLYD